LAPGNFASNKSEREHNNAAVCFASYMVDAFDIQGEQFGQRYLNPRKQESINEPSVFQYSGQLDAAAHGRYYPILLRGVRRFVCGGIT
jgi:hypothetical protein